MNWFEFILFFLGMIIVGIWGVFLIVGKYDIELDLNDKKKKTNKKVNIGEKK